MLEPSRRITPTRWSSGTFPYYDDDRNPQRVFLRGVIGALDTPRTVAPGAMLDYLPYERTFEKNENGLAVTSRLYAPLEPAIVSGLWETLPVHLRAHDKQEATQVAVLARGKWIAVPPGTSPDAAEPQQDITIENTETIRLTRFGHSVDIHLDRPRRVHVAGTIWPGAYQMRDNIRNVRISLVDRQEKPVTITTPLTLQYEIRPAPP